MTKAIRVYNGLFGPDLTFAALRMGDLIAVCNFLEWIRSQHTHVNLKDVQMYIPDKVVFPSEHCLQFRDWLVNNTDYVTPYAQPNDLVELSIIAGTDQTYPSMYNLWNIRQDVITQKQNVFHIPDAVKLPRLFEKRKKIVIQPLFDAPYNANRNWSMSLFEDILVDHAFRGALADYEIVVITREHIINEMVGIKESYDFETNLRHVQEAEIFIGGDTGFSHFAASLVDGPKCEFWYPKTTYGTTNPFYWKTKHNMYYY